MHEIHVRPSTARAAESLSREIAEEMEQLTELLVTNGEQRRERLGDLRRLAEIAELLTHLTEAWNEW